MDAAALVEIVARNRAGARVGITSVCSAHPLVIEATLRHAAATGAIALIEATSNQVDQFGGYSGQTPERFRDTVRAAAREHGLPDGRLILGGDHLGPNPWRDRDAGEAMALATDLVSAYARAGFTKIHLDCSMALGGEPTPLTDATVAQRAATLAAAAERAHAGDGGPVYVIGTEVPVPGGATHPLEHLRPTDPDAARATLAAHRDAFAAAGLDAAFERVVGVVVQPGVEFDHDSIVDFDPSRIGALPEVVAAGDDPAPGPAFEAHSTDYQLAGALAALVADHFAILKVGPELTFAVREALFALEAIESELLDEPDRSQLSATVERRMLADPSRWRPYVDAGADARTQRLARRFSLSDRIRYYWPDPEIEAAERTLLANLRATTIPLGLLHQHLPAGWDRARRQGATPDPRELVLDHVTAVLDRYAAACGPAETEPPR